MKKILITGGSGLIGRNITERLLVKGYDVVWLSTSKDKVTPVKSYFWDPSEKLIDPKALEGVTHIINLAGEPLAQKWTEASMKRMYDSRVNAIQTLYNAIEGLKDQPMAFISASAVGYYPSSYTAQYTEEHESGSDFLARITVAWEREAKLMANFGLREVRLRIGIALDAKGGALNELLPTIRFGLGAPLGTGKQWMPWIHIDDLARMFVYAVENEHLQGVYNACGPNPVTNKTMVKTIGQVLKRPVFLPPVPGFILRMILGKMAQIVLSSTHVSSSKISSAGFEFQFPELKPALENLLQEP